MIDPVYSTPIRDIVAGAQVTVGCGDTYHACCMCGDDVAAMPVTAHRHLERIARLSYLAPGIIGAILDGSQPRTLQARTLWRLSALPLSSNEQHRVLGFAAA